MSVLIKGMDMPKSCGECRFLSYAYNVPLCSVTRQIPTYPLDETLEQSLGKRMNGCPLEDTTEEVRHGRWILGGETGWPKWTCSVCGGDGRGDYKLCPWCGASMDEAEPDDTYCTEESCEIYQRDLSCEMCQR